MALECVNAQEKPNVVFILADDLGNGDISYNNQDPAKFRYTPNLDRICREGLYLENFWSIKINYFISMYFLILLLYTDKIYGKNLVDVLVYFSFYSI